MNDLEIIWIGYLEKISIAFQPIVDAQTDEIYGVEALIRGTDELGFSSISAFFDSAYETNVLYTFDLALREKILQRFSMIDGFENLHLFINLDNRLLQMSNYSRGNTEVLLEKYDLQKQKICFEISEKHEINDIHYFNRTIEHYKKNGFCIAIDDFGVGVSGYQMLYRSTPDLIKIDRFFIMDIDKDMKKRKLVEGIVKLASTCGIKVLAEGIEREEELETCKWLGCHLLQGFYLQKPTQEYSTIQKVFYQVESAV